MSDSAVSLQKSERTRKNKSSNMARLLGWAQHPSHRSRQFSPRILSGCELPAPAPTELVVFGAPVVFRRAPASRDPSSALQAVQRGIEGSLLNPQHIARHLLHTLRNAPAVLRFERQRPQDQQIQSALR